VAKLPGLLRRTVKREAEEDWGRRKLSDARQIALCSISRCARTPLPAALVRGGAALLINRLDCLAKTRTSLRLFVKQNSRNG
jgi:hypothetical protein